MSAISLLSALTVNFQRSIEMIRAVFTGNAVLAMILIALMSFPQSAGCQKPVKQGPPVPSSFCIDTVSMNLYMKVNSYRRQKGLAPIPLSKSLSYVATLHARDLYLHHPDRGPCNFHSWSDKGAWNPFCYPADESKKATVWDKPRELTRYPSKAFEIVYWENNPLEEDTVFMVWKSEVYFRTFLLNSGKWQGKSWNAIGIAVFENYACAWFGEAADPEGEATLCGMKNTGKESGTPPPSSAVKRAKTEPLKNDSSPALKTIGRDSLPARYYIIVRTNLPRDAAEKLAGSLRNGAYPGAKVLDADGKIRVSVFDTQDKPAATAKLREVKQSVYKDAWLLKK
jgi:hypothetical protein